MTPETIALLVAVTAAATAGLIRAYDWVYHRGYTDGHHIGFTEGLYRAAEREARHRSQKPGRYARKLVGA